MPIYEQPLNERSRIFLRLEHLFLLLKEHMAPEDEFGLRSFISTLLSICELILRSDVKTEIIKELERLYKVMLPLQNSKQVDHVQLNDLLERINLMVTTLKDPEISIAHEIKESELLNSIKQREPMPAGNCNFDLPNYHFWLHQSEKIQQQDIQNWYASISRVDDAISLILDLLRNSAHVEQCVAENGFFQKNIDAKLPFQLIRVFIDDDISAYPEISAGKHRINIRMMQQENSDSRPIQYKNNINFKLHSCKI